MLIIFAEKSYSQSFSANLILGLSASQVDGDNYAGYDKPGFMAGGGVSFPLGEKWEFGPEIYYIQKGAKSTENDPYFFLYRINYIEIPLVFKVSLNRFLLTGGIGADVAINGKQDIGSGFTDVANLKRVTPVTVFGFGYSLSEKLTFNARHLYSIGSFQESPRAFNNTIAVYLTYKLN